MKLRDVSPQ